jgi:hypothetical protein
VCVCVCSFAIMIMYEPGITPLLSAKQRCVNAKSAAQYPFRDARGECEKYLKNIKVATAAVAPRYKF